LSESKDRLKFAVDSAGLGTWDYDPQTDELIWDKRCKEIFGFESSNEDSLSSFFEMIHKDDRKRIENKVNDALRDVGPGEFDVEYRTLPINEKTKWLKARGRVYFHGQVATRFVGTMLDITTEKLIDEATRELLRKKDEFISIASHELKTPITSLKAALQIIERTTAQREDMKPTLVFVKKALRQVDKLIELIRDLLDVTKIQAGKLELRKTKFKLDELIAECCEELQSTSPNHQLNIEGNSDFEIYADRNRLEQVIINLLSNAIKYAPESDKVIIKVTKVKEGTKVAITDFGIGIAKDKLPYIFDRFYRVDEKSQAYAGLGLGLYISSEIMRQHNSHINIESEEDKGSTFWFIIPDAKF
jgi:two-component system CheB/CheR fusion protein